MGRRKNKRRNMKVMKNAQESGENGEEDNVTYTNEHHKKTCAKLADDNCDIKLHVGDVTFMAHKKVLSDSSEYFSIMFGSDMVERDQDTIELRDILPSDFELILEYFYTGQITLHKENIGDVLKTASFFHVDWIVNVCCKFIETHLSIENYLEVVCLYDSYFLDQLEPTL